MVNHDPQTISNKLAIHNPHYHLWPIGNKNSSDILKSKGSCKNNSTIFISNKFINILSNILAFPIPENSKCDQKYIIFGTENLLKTQISYWVISDT